MKPEALVITSWANGQFAAAIRKSDRRVLWLGTALSKDVMNRLAAGYRTSGVRVYDFSVPAAPFAKRAA